MNQTKIGYFIETMANVFIGLVVSVIANHFVFPAFGFALSASANIQISIVYTIISIIRQYVLRRWFNARLHKMAMKLAVIDSTEQYSELEQQNAALSEQVAGLVGAVDIWQENPTTGNGFALIDAAAIAKAGAT